MKIFEMRGDAGSLGSACLFCKPWIMLNRLLITIRSIMLTKFARNQLHAVASAQPAFTGKKYLTSKGA